MQPLIRTLLMLLCLSSTLNAQFVMEYASEGKNVRFTALAKLNGNYLAAGTEGKKIILAEIRPNGTLVRTVNLHVLNTETEHPVKSMIVDGDLNIVIAGYRDPINEVASEAFVLKYNWNADSLLWCTKFDSPGSNFFKIIEKGAQGNYLVCGMVRATGLETHSVLIEIDRNSGAWNFLNVSSHNPYNDTYYAIDASATNIYATSRQQFYGGSGDKMRGGITKFDMSGNPIYNYTYLRDTSGYARLYGADILAQTKKIISLYCGGGASTYPSRDLYAVTSKLNGDVKWAKRFDITTTVDDGTWLSIKPVGPNYLIAGSMYNPNDPNGYGHGGKIFVIYCTSLGNIIWANSYEIYSDYYYYLGHTDLLMVEGDYFVLAGAIKNDVTNKYHGALLQAKIEDGVLESGCSTPLSVTVTDEIPLKQASNLYDAGDTYITSNPATPVTTSPLYEYSSYCTSDSIVVIGDVKLAQQYNTVYLEPLQTSFVFSNVTDVTEGYLRIFNMEGKLMLEENMSFPTNQSVHVNNLQAGVYILHVFDSGGQTLLSKKFIKN
ncbi:MAG: T9SS type A sorting domain-containing protein [Bacteroidetes bacterium]|nr:T9SS type A sorting domain-containing protein [Bacteroidota bacterium]